MRLWICEFIRVTEPSFFCATNREPFFLEETSTPERHKPETERRLAMTSLIKIPATISRFGHLTLLLSTSLFLSCPFGNMPSNSSQQSLFANAPGSPVAVQGGPGNVLIGDMNNDRKLDLVVSCARARSITVLEGKGDGQFGAALSNTTLPEPPGEMALGDLNGDGKLDVAVTSHDSYGVTLLTGDGKGGLALAPTSPM